MESTEEDSKRLTTTKGTSPLNRIINEYYKTIKQGDEIENLYQ